jgi:small subunit ribosomal protein S17
MDKKNTTENTKKAEDSTQVKKSTAKVLSGIVVASKMTDTATVEVMRHVKHVKYGKYMKRKQKFLVHDKGNKHAVGERVQIRETRPMSKRKSFEVAD